MKKLRKIKLIAIVSVLFLLCGSITWIYYGLNQNNNDSILIDSENNKNNEWIIKWKNQYQVTILEQVTILDWIPAQGVMRVKLNDNINVNEWINQWKDNPGIEYIQPNINYTISGVPNDKYFSEQYYLQQIKAEKGWEEAFTREVIIGILDTGIDFNHPDLQGRIVGGVNLLNKSSLPIDDNGHGTNVAGVVAAVSNNNIGISGLTRNTKIMPIKVLDEKGEGDSFFVGQGIRYAVDNGANIVLLASGETIYTPFMYEAVNYAEDNGVLVVAAVGNKGSDINYPAALPNVLAVGAVDSKDRYVEYSNYGQQIDVVASGEGIFTTNLGGGYIANSGTSLAAPQVAGLAAFLYQKYPDATPKEIADIIKFSADDIGDLRWDIRTGYGRINVEKALTMDLTKLLDGYEPNNISSLANTFPIGDTFNAQLGSSSDIDWYKLSLPYNGNLKIDFALERYLDNVVQLEIYFKDQLIEEIGKEESNFLNRLLNGVINPTDNTADTNIIDDEENNPTPYMIYQIHNEQQINLDLPKGEYYLKIKYAAEQQESEIIAINYAMTSKYTIYQDNYEPNDRPWNAYQINNISNVIIGTFGKTYDEDWYKIYIPTNGTLSADVKVNTKRSDPVLWLQPVGGVGSEIDYNSSGKAEFGYINVSPGEYLIRVSDYNNNIIEDEYQLNLVFKSADRDSYEPNNLSIQATELNQSSHSIDGVISDREDYDWYKFEVLKPSYLEFNFKAEINIRATLFNSAFGVIWTDLITNWDQNNILEEGTYYLRINSTESKVKYNYHFAKIELIGDFIDINNHYAKEIILEYYNNGFVTGYEDHTFKPDQAITRGEVATIISNTLQLTGQGDISFSDISKDDPIYSDIAKVSYADIMPGYEDNTFKPNEVLSPEMLSTILAKINKEQDTTIITKIEVDINTIPYSSISRAEFLLIFDKVNNYITSDELF